LLCFFLRYKTVKVRKHYKVYIAFIYRDINILILSLLVLLHDFLNIISYGPYLVPIISLIGVYTFESLLLHKRRQSIKKKSIQDISSVEEGIGYIEAIINNTRICNNINRNQNINKEFIEAEQELYAILANHNKDCEQEDCICKSSMKGKDWKLLGKKLLIELVGKYPRDSSLQIFFACIEFHELNNKYKALYNLRRATEMSPNLALQIDIHYIIYLLECKIEC